MKIGIVGAGFSGVALLAALKEYARTSLEVHLFDKANQFAAGHAYSTPYDYHLLNARARDMSAIASDNAHFTRWVEQHTAYDHLIDPNQPVSDQFVPRIIYQHYLQSILDDLCQEKSDHLLVTRHAKEVVDLQKVGKRQVLTLQDGNTICVDKVVLAIGVQPPNHFPFPVSADTNTIINPWHYEAVSQIHCDDPVLIVGTGLSMIDVVLSLHHQKHRGPIAAVSRHGLLPLPHSHPHHVPAMPKEHLPEDMYALLRHLHELNLNFMKAGGDWRTVFNALRDNMPALWRASALKDKKQFLRHVLPYWNIHRHRVPNHVDALLKSMQQDKQLTIYAGRVRDVSKGQATIRLRRYATTARVNTKWVVNCMGFSFPDGAGRTPLVMSLLEQDKAAFDALRLGLDVLPNGALKSSFGTVANDLFALGPPIQGEAWETVAVPEIRQQCVVLTEALLGQKEQEEVNNHEAECNA